MNPHPVRILIADDDLLAREAITAIALEALPQAIIASLATGSELLNHFAVNGADLIITNFQMPGIDGPTLVRILRKSHPDLPIIMVSGSPEAEAEGHDAGVSSFVHKTDIHRLLASEILSRLA
ncbi:MAG: two-component system, LytTR family, response regulator AlgR [Chthoniobacter sp.]|jgi:CheY-like chemotaxis protein|nr:two-component system, LytTR family, response regulator AlgR [Chthoniobacter sp.]